MIIIETTGESVHTAKSGVTGTPGKRGRTESSAVAITNGKNMERQTITDIMIRDMVMPNVVISTIIPITGEPTGDFIPILLYSGINTEDIIITTGIFATTARVLDM